MRRIRLCENVLISKMRKDSRCLCPNCGLGFDDNKPSISINKPGVSYSGASINMRIHLVCIDELYKKIKNGIEVHKKEIFTESL